MLWKTAKVLMQSDGGASGGGGGGGQGGAGTGAGGTGGSASSGTPLTSWRDQIPQEYRQESCLANVPDVPTLVKNYVNAERMIGAKRLVIPGQNATPEQWNEVYNTLGRPESHEKYSQPTVKFADGVTPDQVGLAKARETFHKLGLSDKQAQGILDFYIMGINENHKALQTGMQTTQAQASEALRKDWGDKYDVNLDIAKSALRHFGGEEVLKELESGLGNHVGLIKMLHKVGQLAMEDRTRTGGGSLPVSGQTASLQDIENMKLDADFMKVLNDNSHPGHAAAVARWQDAFRKAYPGKVDVAGG